MSAHRRSPPRGMTLIELMVSLLIGAIAIAAVLGVVQSQQVSYYQGHLQRGAQGAARSALLFIEQRLLTAGWGMDAPLAFDFDRYSAQPCPALAAPCVRDSVDGNDELVFYSRNPRYWVPDNYLEEPVGKAWRITGLAGDTLTVNAHTGDRFVKGQVIQAVCKAGAAWAYFTVSATSDTADAEESLNVTLASSVASDPFRRQDGATDGCFTNGTARLFLIDRFRFHVRPVRVDGQVQPYLVLDQGLDANNLGPDEAEEQIVAEGIETFQVAYVMTNGALEPRGSKPGVQIAFAPGATGATSGDAMTTLSFPGIVPAGQNEYRPTSWFGYAVGPPPATQRNTDHQANIRAVRISIGARSPTPDPARPREEFLLPILNMNALPGWISSQEPFARSRVETTFLLRNMVTRGMIDY